MHFISCIPHLTIASAIEFTMNYSTVNSVETAPYQRQSNAVLKFKHKCSLNPDGAINFSVLLMYKIKFFKPSPLPSFLLLSVPRRHFCCGSSELHVVMSVCIWSPAV